MAVVVLRQLCVHLLRMPQGILLLFPVLLSAERRMPQRILLPFAMLFSACENVGSDIEAPMMPHKG